MVLSKELSCEAGHFFCHLNPCRFSSVRGFEALFPHTGTLGCTVCLALQLFLPVYLHVNVGLPHLQATALPGLVQSVLVKHQLTQVTQPPYSPDLVPCDFWLFPKLKSPLKGKKFQTVKIQENMTE